MKIEDVLEETSLLAINEKTRISIANIEKLVQKDFSGLKKVQLLGFISILEREYGGVFTDLRQASDEYFGSLVEPINPSADLIKEVSSPSCQKWLILFLSLILIAAIWFFYSSLNVKQTQSLVIPEVEELNATIAPSIIDINETDANSSNDTNVTVLNIDNNESAPIDSNITIKASMVKIIPVKRLWFATVDLANKKVTDHSMTNSFEANITGDMLIATSVAPFSMITAAGEKKYNDFRSHYFKVTTGGANEITKEVFVSSGGSKNLTR
jgi:hypothetical protein